ncbi:MAG: M48 family metalloprotease [Cyanosarcina radialis HA8281-LM2]|jgi:predicted Zn-dependent protease|nr:M48 family metalloprotease [Cyanosarcina radialis HA8281-LM2]
MKLHPFSLISSFRRHRWVYPLISVVVALGILVGTPQASRGIELWRLLPGAIQYIQLSNISDRQEVQIGRQVNQRIVSGEVRLNRNGGINRYIDQMGERLARNSTRRNIPYTFQVVEDDRINAFATMGGFVYINTGTIKAADNEAQLASVVAHEIGHIEGRHAIKQTREMALAQGLSTAAGLDSNQAAQIGVQLALRLPHSRRDEYDADRRGLKMMERTGYAPSGIVGFMKKLINQGGSVPTFLSTHPGAADRVEALQEQIGSDGNRGSGLDNRAYRQKISSLL